LSSIIKYKQYASLKIDLALLRETDLFDETYYTAYVPNLKRRNIDPRLHYLLHGGFIGRDPGPNFDSSWVLETYPEIKKAKINPLVHYLRYGKAEKKERHANDKGFLIEFVGIPGSGKSTLYGPVNRLLGDILGYRPGPRDLWTRMADEIRFQAVRGGAYSCLARFIHKNITFISALLQDQANSPEETFLSYFFSLCAFYQSVKDDHTKNWCLFDEGFFYTLFPYFNQNGNKLSRTIVETIPKPDVLIHMNTDVKLCIARMRSRKQGIPIPYRQFDEGGLEKTLARLDKNIRMSLEAIKDHPIKVIHIDSDFRLDDALSLIMSAIGPRLTTHR
jgi:thymidylate kinase